MWSQKLISAVAEIKPTFLDINDRFVSALDRQGQVHIFDATASSLLHTCDTGSLEAATAVALRPPHVLLGIEAKVELRTLQDDLPDGPLTRFTANVTCISASASRLVGIGSSDFTAKVVELDDGDCYVGEVVLKGHSGPLLSVALDPEAEYLATSACDGTARIWLAGSGKQIRSWPVGQACSDVALAASPCPLAWEPLAGRVLAMPVDCELRLLARDSSWPTAATCSSDLLRGPILCCVWSQQADFIAAGSRDGAISAWSIAWSDAPLRESSLRQASPYFALRSPGLCPLRQLFWWWRSPDDGAAVQPTLVYLDAKGDIRTTEVRKNCSSRPLLQQQQQKQPPKQLTEAEVLAEAELADIDPRDLVDEFEIEMTQQELEKPTKKSATAPVGGLQRDDIADNDDYDDQSGDNEAASDKDDKENRDEKPKKTKKKRNLSSSSESSSSGDSAAGSTAPAHQKSVHRRVNHRRQRPVQPGSTGGCPRYLVWNRLGCVLEAASAMPEQPRILTVEFHDSAAHHGLIIPNNHGFSLAALSLRLLVLAAPSTAEALSFVRVRPLSGTDGGEYGGGAEWTQALPRGEDVVCLATGDNRLFAGSDRRTVRIWSSRGLQLAALSAPGPLIALSAWPRGFAIVHGLGGGSSGSGGDGSDNDDDDDCPVAADMYEMSECPTPGEWPVPKLVRAEVRIPLTARSRLTWLGHCQQSGSLCVQDSRGVIRAVMPNTGGAWCPLLNGRTVLTERTDWLWPIGVILSPSGDYRIAAVHCRNSAEPSAVAARPPIRYYPLAPLMCPNPLAELEASLALAASFGQQQSAGSNVGEHQLRLFAQALKSGEESRAADVAAWMSERVLRLAIQYAVKAKRVKLVDRLTALGEAMIAARSSGASREVSASSLSSSSTLSPSIVIQPTPVKRRKRESCEPSAH